jgi:acetolactate synthase-1/2/3 large subunit
MPPTSSVDQVIQKIQENIPGDALIITDIGPHQVHPYQNKGRTLNNADGTGTIGFGLPAAIGASFHHKDRDIWVVTDNDSVQATITELGTAVQENANINIVILTNRSPQWAQMFPIKTPLHGPDYAKLAEAYGLSGYRVDKLEDAKPALQKARGHNGPVLIEFVVKQQEPVYAMASTGTGLHPMPFSQPQFENMGM